MNTPLFTQPRPAHVVRAALRDLVDHLHQVIEAVELPDEQAHLRVAPAAFNLLLDELDAGAAGAQANTALGLMPPDDDIARFRALWASATAACDPAQIVLLPKDEWLPIEGAPDDEPVLIRVPGVPWPMQGTRSEVYGCWTVGARGIVGCRLPAGMEPDAWMPLPKAVQEGEVRDAVGR